MSMDERKSDLAVMDAREYSQKRQLRMIFDAREKVEDKADEAEELYVTGQIREQARNLMILQAVREYIRSGWTLLLDHAAEVHEDKGEKSEYLETRPLGKMEHGGQTVEWRGLWDVLKGKEVFQFSRGKVKSYPHGPDQTEVVTEERAVPREVSWEACLTMTEFLSEEAGLQLKTEEIDDSLDNYGYDTIDIDDIPPIEDHDGPVDLRALRENGENGE